MNKCKIIDCKGKLKILNSVEDYQEVKICTKCFYVNDYVKKNKPDYKKESKLIEVNEDEILELEKVANKINIKKSKPQKKKQLKLF